MSSSANVEDNLLSADAAYYLLPKLEIMLKEAAATAGWPAQISAQLKVEYIDGSIAATWPNAISEQVLDLEHGGIASPPRSILQTFDDYVQPLVKKILDDETIDQLMSMEGVF
jgi:hypothetical protein